MKNIPKRFYIIILITVVIIFMAFCGSKAITNKLKNSLLFEMISSVDWMSAGRTEYNAYFYDNYILTISDGTPDIEIYRLNRKIDTNQIESSIKFFEYKEIESTDDAIDDNSSVLKFPNPPEMGVVKLTPVLIKNHVSRTIDSGPNLYEIASMSGYSKYSFYIGSTNIIISIISILVIAISIVIMIKEYLKTKNIKKFLVFLVFNIIECALICIFGYMLTKYKYSISYQSESIGKIIRYIYLEFCYIVISLSICISNIINRKFENT